MNEDVSSLPATRTARRRLGEVLVEQGAVTEQQLEAALEAQRDAARDRRRIRLGQLLVELGFASERQIATALAGALALEMVDLGTLPLQTDVARLLPRTVAERHLVVPISRDDSGQVTLACADPTNVLAIDDVKLYAGINDLRIVVASATQVRDLIARIWALSEDNADVAMMLEEIDESVEATAEDDQSFADAPTVRLVNSILADAVRARASDIHVEPQATQLRVRYRVDGLLRDVMTAPRTAAAGVISRIKVMSNLDIAERRVPQDGRTRLQIEGALLDARVSTLPNIHGEKVVIRLLSRADSVPPLTKIGMGDQQLESLMSALVSPQGLVLITGPTGSGKTSTLYSAIQHIKTPDRNIVTLEDPVEMQVTGITQVQVHERSGMTFSRGLRSVLRQDPDVVLVGEVRDSETANLALEASLTGHQVLTTLHTNSAPAALTRLIDMGVEPFLVASSLTLVVAQRLVRRVCDACAQPRHPRHRRQGSRAGEPAARFRLQRVRRHRLPRPARHLRGAAGHGRHARRTHVDAERRRGRSGGPRRRHADTARQRDRQGQRRAHHFRRGPAGHPGRLVQRRALHGVRWRTRRRHDRVSVVRSHDRPRPLRWLRPAART
jgi:type IV pilus assembly protein PilB